MEKDGKFTITLILKDASSSFDKALLSLAEGLRTNGIGISSIRIISCALLSTMNSPLFFSDLFRVELENS